VVKTKSGGRVPKEVARFAANVGLTEYRPSDVLELAEHGARLGILFHIGGMPFGEHRPGRYRRLVAFAQPGE